MDVLMLAGKVAVITGGGRGLGKETAKLFVREGAKVALLDITGDEEWAAQEIGADALGIRCDVSKEDEVKAAFDATLAKFGRIDCVVNNAGTVVGRKGGKLDMDEFRRMIDVNLIGVVLCSEQGVEAMLRQGGGGAIINITTVGALNAEKQAPLGYAAGKLGVHSITKAFAIDHGKDNIRANVLAPGFAYTDVMEGMSEEASKYMSNKAALGRPGKASEIAEVALFLASDRSSFITGAIIPVDGGWSARLA
jgi:NAD(P)-dependent dehydrogenase (short-subunit alcohol dehydrogenase family)